ncbi:MAG: MFS transporter [Pseudomonas sp.]|uniref:MFS transporter n=1 Tax=Pseudomonas sp. TaxID=306 RepID=UPI003981DF4D
MNDRGPQDSYDPAQVDPAVEVNLEKAGSSVRLEEPSPPVSPWLPVALSSALFMELLDTAALGMALPAVARDFGMDVVTLKLALTAYLLTMAVFVPASGWLADRFGARRVFVNALKIYMIGSLVCALSDSMSVLVIGRVIQGLGGAMMVPVARLIVVASTPRERLVKAINAFTIPAIVGPLLGPPLAGVLLEVANWRWIFLINLPVGLVGMYAVLRLVPRLRHPHPGRFDTSGFVLAGISIVAFVALAELLGMPRVWWPWKVAVACVALLGCLAYVAHARGMDKPVLDLRLMSRRTYRASMIGSTAMRLGFGATPFLVPALLQVGLGWSPLRAGSVMMAMMVGSVLARFGGMVAVRYFGFRMTLIASGVGVAILTATPALFQAATPLWLIMSAFLLLGFLRAAHFVAATPLAFAEIVPEEVSRASTLATVIQQLGLSMGVSLAGIALAWSPTDALSLASFAAPFAVLGLAALLTVPAYAGLNRDEAAHMRGST